MEVIKAEMIEVNVTVGVVCNKCGKDTKKNSLSEYAVLSAQWEYDSNKDGRTDSAHLCEECYDEFVASFKIEPEVKLDW